MIAKKMSYERRTRMAYAVCSCFQEMYADRFTARGLTVHVDESFRYGDGLSLCLLRDYAEATLVDDAEYFLSARIEHVVGSSRDILMIEILSNDVDSNFHLPLMTYLLPRRTMQARRVAICLGRLFFAAYC